jgi:hypothetical protein
MTERLAKSAGEAIAAVALNAAEPRVRRRRAAASQASPMANKWG